MPILLQRLHRWMRNTWLFNTLTVFTRVLLGIGFIVPGLAKVVGERFHNPDILTPDTAIGGFFEAFFLAEEFYLFIGAMQVLAGVLLLIPRLATLGAAIYLPIIANIFVITVAMEFTGTWIITGFMLLAVIYLLVWDLPRFLPILGVNVPSEAIRSRVPVSSVAYGLMLVGISMPLMLTRGPVDLAALLPAGGRVLAVLLGVVCFIAGTLAMAVYHRRTLGETTYQRGTATSAAI